MAGARRRFSVRRTTIVSVATLLVVWIVLLVAAVAVQETFIFPRWVIPQSAWASEAPEGVEVLTLQVNDGTVPAWLWPGEPGQGLIVLLHGNGVVINQRIDLARHLHEQGWHVLLPEYRGYGMADGSPSQAAITEDVTAFVQQVQSRAAVSDTLVLHGRSIGSAFAAVLAEDLGADALILQTPPAGIRQMAARYLMPGFVLRNPLDTEAALRHIDPPRPVLVIEHAQDRLIPADQVARVVKAAGPKVTHVVVDGTHNEYGSTASHRRAEAAVLDMLESVAPGGVPEASVPPGS